MNKHHNTDKQNHDQRQHTAIEAGLEQVALDLNRLANKRLPNRVLQGILKGYEDEIRQDAVILALQWFLRGESGVSERAHDWIPAKAIASTLQIAKRDYLKALKGEAERNEKIEEHIERVIWHPSQIATQDLPIAILRELAARSIREAHKSGQISEANAAVAMAVFVDLIPVQKLARCLGVHRSAIYQQLYRVKRHLPKYISQMDIQMSLI